MDLFKKIRSSVAETLASMDRDAEVKHWLEELYNACEREKNWRKEAQRVVDIFEQQKAADNEDAAGSDFNILYANTETLSPAIYNNTPRPVVKRKVDKENPVAIAAALVLKNVLSYLVDTGDRDYATFDALQVSAVQEALTAGRGLSRFEYDATTEGDVVTYESVCGSQVPWNRVLYGYAKDWQNIPWQAYEHFMTRQECIATFGERLGKEIKLTHSSKDDGDDDRHGPEDAKGVKFAHIYEVWDKATRKVFFVSDGHPRILKREGVPDDPLGLDGFFNSPQPIMLLRRVSSLVPQTLYLMYESQAKELETVTRRIGHLTKAMKIRGFYDGTLQGLDTLLSSPENTLLPATNVAAMQQGQTLEKAIWFMPLEQLIQVLQQLYLNRQQIIGVIHQLTGVADIMRGASAASETLGAQKMKEAWGTMRLKRMQKEVQRFTRDCFRIQAELAAKHFGLETLQKMTGLKFPTMGEKQLAQREMAMLQAQAQQAQAMGQPIPPEVQKQGQEKMAELQATLGKPSWEDINAFLKSDSIRNYTIDIETNSTIDIEATEDKEELAELMNSLSQLMNGVFPMVKEGVLPFQAAKALLLGVLTKFRIGDEVEEVFRAMQEPQPKADPAAQKVEAEMKRDEQKFQMEQEDRQQELAQKKELAQMELQIQREELEMQREELAMKRREMQEKHRIAMEALVMKAVMPPAAPAPQPGGEGGENAGA
jgi:hypothetical protein